MNIYLGDIMKNIFATIILFVAATAIFAGTQPVPSSERGSGTDLNARLVRDVYGETRAIVVASAAPSDEFCTMKISWNEGAFSLEGYRFTDENVAPEVVEGSSELVLYAPPEASIEIELTLRFSGEADGKYAFSLDVVSSGTGGEQSRSPDLIALHRDITLSGEAEDAAVPAIPTEMALRNSPNPFNSATTIKYDLPERCFVRVDIYDVLGRAVRTLACGEKPAGFYRAVWDGTDLQNMHVSSGIYFVKLAAGDKTRVVKMQLIK